MTYHGQRGPGFTNLEKVVRRATKLIKPYADQYDAIIVRGVSGLMVGAPVALRVRKPLLILRKDDEKCHGPSGELLGWHPKYRRVLFLDDFISTGETRAICQRAVVRASKGESQVVLQAEYQYENVREVSPLQTT